MTYKQYKCDILLRDPWYILQCRETNQDTKPYSKCNCMIFDQWLFWLLEVWLGGWNCLQGCHIPSEIWLSCTPQTVWPTVIGIRWNTLSFNRCPRFACNLVTQWWNVHLCRRITPKDDWVENTFSYHSNTFIWAYPLLIVRHRSWYEIQQW